MDVRSYKTIYLFSYLFILQGYVLEFFMAKLSKKQTLIPSLNPQLLKLITYIRREEKKFSLGFLSLKLFGSCYQSITSTKQFF